MARAPALRKRLRREVIADDGDLTGEYAYLTGLIDFIAGENVVDARRYHEQVPVQALVCSVAKTIHRALGETLKASTPTIHDIAPAIRRVAGVTAEDLGEEPAIGLYQRMIRAIQKLTSKGAYIVGITNRVQEINELYARQAGLDLVDKFRDAMEDRSSRPEAIAGLRRHVDWVESLILQRPSPTEEVELVTRDTVEAKPMAWLWPQRLIGNGLNVVTGLMGQTKGFFMVDVAAKITRGSRWEDGTGHAPRGSVLWVGNEDDPATVLRPRLDAAGADVSKVHYVAGVRSGSDADEFRPISIGNDLPRIAAALDRVPDCRMIVLDPVTEFMDADENASKEIRSELMPLVRLAGARGVALVVVCHQNKKQGLSTLQKIAGGGAFGQIARAVLAFTEDPSEEDTDDLQRKRLMVVAKMSGGKKNVGQAYRLKMPDGHTVPAIEWVSGELAINADEIGFKPSGGRANQERTGDAVDMLRDLLANGPRKAREVWDAMEAAGHGRRQRENAADKLSVVKKQSGREWVWSLPLEAPAGDVGPDGVYHEFDSHALPEEPWTSPFPA